MTESIVYSTSMSKKCERAGASSPDKPSFKIWNRIFWKRSSQCIDLLDKTGIRLWQILPLGPTGYGDSPYAVRSSFRRK